MRCDAICLGMLIQLVDRSVTKLDILGKLHTPETVSALENYRRHLRTVSVKLEERRAAAVAELEGYGADGDGESGKGRETGQVGDIAQQYGKLVKEIEAVKMEIGRLEKS